MRRRAEARLKGLRELAGELRAGCEAAAAECRRVEEQMAGGASARPEEDGKAGDEEGTEPAAVDCARCAVRSELERARVANVQLRTDMAELLGFLEEISGLLTPPAARSGEEPFD